MENKTNIIMETTHKGFPIQLIQESEHYFKVISPFFKDGVSASSRKTKKAALYQGYYLIHCVYNYEDIRRETLNEKGLEILKNTDIVSEQPYP